MDMEEWVWVVIGADLQYLREVGGGGGGGVGGGGGCVWAGGGEWVGLAGGWWGQGWTHDLVQPLLY